MHTIARYIEIGGWPMYPLLACYVAAYVLGLGRVIALYRPRPRLDRLVSALFESLRAGDVARALAICNANPSALARVAAHGLRAALLPVPAIETALRGQCDVERAEIERGTPYFASLTKVATLVGLLGTLLGLCLPIGCQPTDATSRASMLARAIAESMTCTAGGLLVSTLALACYAMFRARERFLTDELRTISLTTRNLLVEYRSRLRFADQRASVEALTYR